MSFRGDIRPLVLEDLVEIGLLQTLVSHHCGKLLRDNKNEQN